MSRGFLVCNYNSLLPLFRLLDCLDFVPKTPFCLVSVPFRHLPIIVQRLPCVSGRAVCFRLISPFPALSHPFVQRICSFQWWRSFFGCQESVSIVDPCPQTLLWVIFTRPSFSVSLYLFLSCPPSLTSLSSLLPLFLPVYRKAQSTLSSLSLFSIMHLFLYNVSFPSACQFVFLIPISIYN